MKSILVIDGQGGKIGGRIISELISANCKASITAVGTNSMATANMIKSGASQVATGENAVVCGARSADIIVGPVGIAIADSLFGEVSPLMANAVGQSLAQKVFIPVNKCHNYIVGITKTTDALITEAVSAVLKLLAE